jgi:hypothetical protein
MAMLSQNARYTEIIVSTCTTGLSAYLAIAETSALKHTNAAKYECANVWHGILLTCICRWYGLFICSCKLIAYSRKITIEQHENLKKISALSPHMMVLSVWMSIVYFDYLPSCQQFYIVRFPELWKMVKYEAMLFCYGGIVLLALFGLSLALRVYQNCCLIQLPEVEIFVPESTRRAMADADAADAAYVANWREMRAARRERAAAQAQAQAQAQSAPAATTADADRDQPSPVPPVAATEVAVDARDQQSPVPPVVADDVESQSD